MVAAKARIKNGKLTAKVKYPLVGGAELELGTFGAKLKTMIKVPFLFSAKLFGMYKSKKEEKK